MPTRITDPGICFKQKGYEGNYEYQMPSLCQGLTTSQPFEECIIIPIWQMGKLSLRE